MKNFIEKAFQEDIPNSDITTTSLGVKEKVGIAKIIAKQDLVLSGRDIFNEVLEFKDPQLKTHWHFQDGDQVLSGQTMAQIEGNLIQVIQAERVALNFLGYLSGIATQTRKYVEACKGTQTQILDTRKTLPLYRELAKKAVVDGGGTNHRMNLSDQVMIKENHVQIAGGFRLAIEKIKSETDAFIEVETTNLEEVKEAVSQEVNQIMLDNMSDQTMSEALKLIPDSIKTEASGNMTLERISQVASLGVDFISVGALTHSVTNADISMLFDWE